MHALNEKELKHPNSSASKYNKYNPINNENNIQ